MTSERAPSGRPAPASWGPSGRVLLVDDEPLFLRSLERLLRGEGHEIAGAGSWEGIAPELGRPELDVVLLDLVLGTADGLDLLERIKELRPDVEVVILSGHASIERAVDAMRLGAFDVLEKSIGDVHRLRNTIRRAIERRRLVVRTRELEEELASHRGHAELIGSSAAMRAVLRTVHSLRHNQSTVLIEGESGTGKELVARAVHVASPRRDRPFVPVDCGALPESIIESELFGHERGAFTGALGAPGLFRVADGGTLFLDEVGEIPQTVQAKLLRALQEKEVRPVGATGAVPVDIRVICATNRSLREMVMEGSFRQDLYYRLNVVRLELPPLRERSEDVPLLAQHLLQKHQRPGAPVRGFTPEALERLCRHDWPGNVRELENAVEAALALAQGDLLDARDLPLGAAAPAGGTQPAAAPDLPLSLGAYEKAALQRALEETQGDASEAARRLGIGRSTLYRKLARHGIEVRRRSRAADTSCVVTDSVR